MQSVWWQEQGNKQDINAWLLLTSGTASGTIIQCSRHWWRWIPQLKRVPHRPVTFLLLYFWPEDQACVWDIRFRQGQLHYKDRYLHTDHLHACSKTFKNLRRRQIHPRRRWRYYFWGTSRITWWNVPNFRRLFWGKRTHYTVGVLGYYWAEDIWHGACCVKSVPRKTPLLRKLLAI